MTQNEWDVIGLYSVFVFKKAGESITNRNISVQGHDRNKDKFYVINAETHESTLFSLSDWKKEVNS